MKDIDPYGEEDWENESVNENNEYIRSIKISDIYKEYNNLNQRIKKLNELFLGKIIDIEFKKIESGVLLNKIIDYFYINQDSYTSPPDPSPHHEEIHVKFKNGSYTDVADSDIYHIKKEPKIIFSPEDPYGEEDWNESVKFQDDKHEHQLKKLINPKIGDRIIYIYPGGREDRSFGLNINYDKLYGKVVSTIFIGLGGLGIEFDKFIDGHDCQYSGKEGHCFNVPLNCIFVDEEFENRKKQEEDRKLKYIDIDPYGEEDW